MPPFIYSLYNVETETFSRKVLYWHLVDSFGIVIPSLEGSVDTSSINNKFRIL